MAKKIKPGNTVTDPQRVDGEPDSSKVPNAKKEHWRREAVSFLCDLMPQVEIPGSYNFGVLRMPVVSHADASKMLPHIADAIGMDKTELARRFANAWVPRRTALWEKLWGNGFVDRPPASQQEHSAPAAKGAKELRETERHRAKNRRRKSLPRFGIRRCRYCYGNPVLSLNQQGYAMICDDCGARTDRARSRSMVLAAWEKHNGYNLKRGVVACGL